MAIAVDGVAFEWNDFDMFVSVTGANTLMEIRTETGSDWVFPFDPSGTVVNGVIPVGFAYSLDMKPCEVRFTGGTVSYSNIDSSRYVAR